MTMYDKRNPLVSMVPHLCTALQCDLANGEELNITELVDVGNLALLHLPFEDDPQMLNRV